VNLGPAEILVILVIALLVFGPQRLPEIGRQVGGALREVRKVQSSVRSEISSALQEPAPTLPPRREAVVDEAVAVNRGEPDVGHPEPPDNAGHARPEPSTAQPDGGSFL
jgi:sec-independent protein translocase protein TatA